MRPLSIVIITYNEEHNIRRCLESLQGIGDEILVVDSGSLDSTTDICRSMGATVIEQDFLGYIEQKNFATSKAKNDWVLSLDADEALTPELKTSILAIIDNPQADGYTINRLTNYCGTWVRHSGWYPDVKLRLYNRQKGQWTGINPHDRFRLNLGSKMQHLKGDILHYSYASVSDHIKQIDRFSTIGAISMHNQGKRSSILKILYKPMARFMRHFVFKAGFLDGLTGYTIAVNSAHAVFLKYLRLYYLEKDKSI
ncbi:MAG TPA: glycosyltransferase family 2 protein [Saprospiraceae bacterium]|nr:glycosyltransferase family 2 protein [Saprospiraceae bacterium]